ncbi:MAG: alanine:cation symporter family protein [Desulfovermiculus sp.]
MLVFIGAVINLDIVWTFADVMNGMMIIPNLIALLALSPVIFRITQEYFVNQK